MPLTGRLLGVTTRLAPDVLVLIPFLMAKIAPPRLLGALAPVLWGIQAEAVQLQ